MKTTKRWFWTLAATLGIAAATAGPTLAGLQTNHTESLAGR